MDYIVSARKYRPQTFASVVGQSRLTTTLKNAIRSSRLAHAYLFCGPRGVGKTTCARIFARVLNCLSPTTDGEACLECESCVAMREQRSYNIFELDAASHNGVDDIRDLIEQTRIPPAVGRYKVFIIDEVHMLSTAAFNAFLKTLEEPPSHVIFILATTEKHKLLPTIISRCQIYDFERISLQGIIDHLALVAQQEGYSYEEEALAVIAASADGAMRDALSIFDSVASYCSGAITYAKTIEDLNILDTEYYFRLVGLALEHNIPALLLLFDEIINKGFDALNVCLGLARHLRNVMLAHEASTTALLEVSAPQQERLKVQAALCSSAFLWGSLKLLNDCEMSYRQSANKRLKVELTLIQMAQIGAGEDDPTLRRGSAPLKPIFSPSSPSPSSSPSSPSTSPSEDQSAKVSAAAEDKDAKPVLLPLTEERLTAAWGQVCAALATQSEGKSLAARLRALQPTVKSATEVEVVVEGSMLYDEIKRRREEIEALLRGSIGIDALRLTPLRVVAEEPTAKKTPAQALSAMRQGNPHVDTLLRDLGLEIA